MTEYRFFQEGTIPECTTAEWYTDRERAPHLEQTGHQERLVQAEKFIWWTINNHHIKSVVDLGAGDGGLLSLLESAPISAWGYDLCPNNIKGAQERNVDVELLDVVSQTESVIWGELAVCTEMLEHLLDPHGFVKTIGDNTEWIVASSPWNESTYSHYEYHVWAWDIEGYKDLLKVGGFKIMFHKKLDFQFQVVLAKR